jgi:hypothetical protein
MSPTRGVLRGLRAASLGGVGFGLTLTAHLAAGGSAPGPVVLLTLAGLTGLVAVLLTGARLGRVAVGVALTAMQLVLHQAFIWLATAGDCSMSGMDASAGGHLSPGGQPMLKCATGMAHAGMSQTSMSAATTMLAAHVVATAAMAALLAYGEKALWFLAGYLRPARWLHVRLPELSALRIRPSCVPQRLPARFACGGVGQRGPPAGGRFAIV